MRLEDLVSALGPHLGDRRRALDPMSELPEVLIEEHEDRDRLELPLVQIALHDVVVLISEKDPYVELSAVLRESSQPREVRDHIAPPALREHDDLHRPRQRAKRSDIVLAQVDAPFVLFKALAVPRHLRLVCLVRQPLVEASPIDRHRNSLPRCPDDGITGKNASGRPKIPARAACVQPPNRSASTPMRSAIRSIVTSGGGPDGASDA